MGFHLAKRTQNELTPNFDEAQKIVVESVKLNKFSSTERAFQIYRLMLQSQAGNRDPRVWACVFELNLFKNLT